MKNLLRALLIVAAAAACESPAGPKASATDASFALTPPPPSNCDYCAFGPQIFVRANSQYAQPETVTFDTDPNFQYFLVVQLVRGPYTETTVMLNGTKYSWDSRQLPELRVPVTLQATGNVLSVRVAGPLGTAVNVWIETDGSPI